MLNHHTAALTRWQLAQSVLSPLRTISDDYELLYLDATAGLALVQYLRKNVAESMTLRQEIVQV
jgi:hypothetical protein